jgi:hypothetical protein
MITSLGLMQLGGECNRMYYWIARHEKLPVPLAMTEFSGFLSPVGWIRWARSPKKRKYMYKTVTYKSWEK